MGPDSLPSHWPASCRPIDFHDIPNRGCSAWVFVEMSPLHLMHLVRLAFPIARAHPQPLEMLRLVDRSVVEIDWVHLVVLLKRHLIKAVPILTQFSIAFILLTTRTSKEFSFRAVLGVFTRNLPGVLKISATFLSLPY